MTENENVQGNEKEMGDRYSLIRRALRAHVGMGEYENFDDVSVFDEYVIVKRWESKDCMAYPYVMEGDDISFGEPTPVDVVYRSKDSGVALVTVNETARRTADGSFVSAVVDGLLTALGRRKDEEQTAIHAGKDDEMDDKVEIIDQAEVPAVNEQGEKPEETTGDEAVLVNLATLVEELSQRLDALDAKLTANADRERQALVQSLATNERCPFDEEELQSLSMAHLQKLATAYQPADYSAGSGIVTQRDEQFEDLAMPEWVVATGKGK